MRIKTSFATLMLLALFSQSVNADYSITVFGSSEGHATAEDAVDAAEADYYLNVAEAILVSPDPHLSTGVPETTVYPNPDGTFDAVTSGEVVFYTDEDWFSAWGWWWPG